MSPCRLVTPFMLAAIVVIDAGGCSHGVDVEPTPAVATKPARFVPPADRYVSSVLLNFDSAQDAAFVDDPNVRFAAVDSARPSNRALAISGPTSIKLGALVRGREFPGPWDLVGLRIRSERNGSARMSLRDASGVVGRATETVLQAGVWQTLWIETAASGAVATTQPDAMRLDIRSDGPLLVDDVVLAQGRTTVSDSVIPQTGQHWTVQRDGRVWTARVNDAIVFSLPAAPFIESGYSAVEANAVRAVFRSPGGSTIAIDRLGRLIEDGRARSDPRLARFAKTTAENANPALVEVLGEDDSAGRVERTLPGDRDNDGYDDSRGCYTVRAASNRIALRLTARGGPVRWPVVEVINLPPGEVGVYVEGQTVPWTTRLQDGRVIVELPIELASPVEVQIRVK